MTGILILPGGFFFIVNLLTIVVFPVVDIFFFFFFFYSKCAISLFFTNRQHILLSFYDRLGVSRLSFFLWRSYRNRTRFFFFVFFFFSLLVLVCFALLTEKSLVLHHVPFLSLSVSPPSSFLTRWKSLIASVSLKMNGRTDMTARQREWSLLILNIQRGRRRRRTEEKKKKKIKNNNKKKRKVSIYAYRKWIYAEMSTTRITISVSLHICYWMPTESNSSNIFKLKKEKRQTHISQKLNKSIAISSTNRPSKWQTNKNKIDCN